MTTPKQLPLFNAALLDLVAANDPSAGLSTFKERQSDPFYRTKGWRLARGRVLAQRGPRCEICGATAATCAQIDVHHRVPISEAPRLALYLPNLQVVCCDCHISITYLYRLRLPRRAPHEDEDAA